jgi:hypothetical protein
MEVGDENIKFNFYDAMKYPYSNVYFITCYDQVDKCVQQVFDFDCEDGLSVALSYDYDLTEIKKMERNICVPPKHAGISIGFASFANYPL